MTDSLVSAEIVSGPERYRPTPHPLIRWFTREQIESMRYQPGGPERLLAAYHLREEAIQLSELDPLNHTVEPYVEIPGAGVVYPWSDTRKIEQDPDVDIVAVFGGNRAVKSFGALHDLAVNIDRYPDSLFVCVHEDVTTSIEQQQRWLWHFLKRKYDRWNFKKDPKHKYWIHYSDAGGFSDRKVIFPNGSKCFFFTYNEDPGDIEGWEFGSKAASIFCVHLEESCSLPWLKMFARRLKFRRAKARWTFTAINGITPAMKELLGKTARTLRSLPAELLPNSNVPGCPRGEMPYIQIPEMPRTRAIYYHSQFNRFYVGKPDQNGYSATYWDQIRKDCYDAKGKAKATFYIERVAYGYARDTVARAFPLFGPWNVVQQSQLPIEGTNYRFIDPAGDKNWFVIWARVTRGNPPDIYIYRDWPDAQTYGEWAVPTMKVVTADSKVGWDGDAGPAQIHTSEMPSGWVGHKRQFLDLERVGPDEADPYRRKLYELGRAGARAALVTREDIYASFIDPRAGRNPQEQETGTTCLIDKMNEVQEDPSSGEVIGPSMPCYPGSGIEPRFRIDTINELLRWDPAQTDGLPMRPINAPRLYVSENCHQVIWALSNYTGRAGELGPAKDPIDCVGYLAEAPLSFVDPAMLRSTAGGSY